MFDLVEAPTATRSRTRLTAAVSYTLQLAGIAALFSLPLLHTAAISIEEHHVLPPYRYEPKPVQVVSTQTLPPTRTQQQAAINPLIPPQHIPTSIDRRPDPPSAPVIGSACVACVPIPGSPDGARDTVLDSMLRTPPPLAVHHVIAPVVRKSNAQESLLIRKVQPLYPPIAVQARVQGDVVLQATISRQGVIQHLQVVAGHPLLVRAARDAVTQWLYRPYILNGEPVEVETQITVHFILGAR